MMEEVVSDEVQKIIEMKRHLNAVEHMLYVSCKFTKTTEMLRKAMQSIITAYEKFFDVAYDVLIGEQDLAFTVFDRIELLKDALFQRGVTLEFQDYFLLKRLMISDFDTVGEYRKNLAIISYIDGEEYKITIAKLLEFYDTLKFAVNSLKKDQF